MFANPCFSWYKRRCQKYYNLEAILLKILWFLFQRNTYASEERPSIECIAAKETRNAQANWPCYYWNLGSRGRVGIMGDQGVCWEVRKWFTCDQMLKIFVTSELKNYLFNSLFDMSWFCSTFWFSSCVSFINVLFLIFMSYYLLVNFELPKFKCFIFKFK